MGVLINFSPLNDLSQEQVVKGRVLGKLFFFMSGNTVEAWCRAEATLLGSIDSGHHIATFNCGRPLAMILSIFLVPSYVIIIVSAFKISEILVASSIVKFTLTYFLPLIEEDWLIEIPLFSKPLFHKS